MVTKKFFINKSDEATSVIERVLSTDADIIVLSIPRFSKFSESEQNFDLLKRESESSGKEVAIESVDDRVIELSSACGISATNPFFVKPERQFSDIVANPKIRRVEEPAIFAAAKLTRIPSRERSVADMKSSVSRRALTRPKREGGEDIREELEAAFGPVDDGGRRFSPLKVFLFLVVLAVISGGGYTVLRVLPRADITITRQKTDFVYNDGITVDKSLKTPDLAAMKLPGQIFTEKRNASFPYPATGKKDVQKKAGGTITVYNAYSSEKQTLVASTRFATDDGKVYRITKGLTVPGAAIVDGKIVPSKVETEVVADKAGEDSNIGAGLRLSIPGFKGTPKYQGFYGETKGPLSGGYVGVAPYPTDEDIRKAKEAASKTLSDNIKAMLAEKITGEFKTIDGSYQFKILKQTVVTDVDDKGDFSIVLDAQMDAMAFREADLLSALKEKLAKDVGPDYETLTQSVSYGLARVDFDMGKMSFPLDYKSVIVRTVDVSDLRGKVMGKSELELKSFLLSLPGLERARIALWPFWVRHVPKIESKVRITIE